MSRIVDWIMEHQDDTIDLGPAWWTIGVFAAGVVVGVFAS